MFETYKHKIHVWVKMSPKTAPHLTWAYAWSTNAYPTCKSAVKAAKTKNPELEFKASFAKD